MYDTGVYRICMCRFSFLSFPCFTFNFQPTNGHFYDTWIICNFIGTDPCSTVGVCVCVCAREDTNL